MVRVVSTRTATAGLVLGSRSAPLLPTCERTDLHQNPDERDAAPCRPYAAATDSNLRLQPHATLIPLWRPAYFSARCMARVPDDILDRILALQLTVAWAGEGLCEPRRLGWWDTDLIDDAGGGDLIARLAPRTHAWASLELAREAARRTDARARAKTAYPDRMRSLFFLGFELDEQLGDRLAALKRGGMPPAEALPLPLSLDSNTARDELAQALGAGGTERYTVIPGARQLKGPPPGDPETLVRRLAAALLPFADHYPLPFFQVAP
jgi:hypothetical protein